MSLFDMSDQVVVVTGSTKGIGLGIVQQAAAHGARVVVSSRDQAACDEVARKISEDYGQGKEIAKGRACDITSLESVEAFAAAARDAFGAVNTLVCNAAVLPFVGPSAETPPGEFERILNGNVHSNFRLCQALRPDIAKQGGGSIVLIGSIGGHVTMPMIMAYAAAKAAVPHLARCLADEFAPDKIRVNCVAPGLIRSASSSRSPLSWEERVAAFPIKRPGEPEDIAGAVIYLSPRAGSYVTGETILVDGGRARLSASNQGAGLQAIAGMKFN